MLKKSAVEKKRLQARIRKQRQRERERSIKNVTHGSHAGVKAAASNSTSGWQLRPVYGQGPYTTFFNTFFPGRIDAVFYEFLRENISLIDAAINRLVSLDGHIVIKGDNAALVEEIKEWVYNVPVNDIQKGLQAFHQNLTNETFEQGFGLGEFTADKKRADIIGLRVADSKTIKFDRVKMKGELLVYQKTTGDSDYRLLDMTNLMYFSINNENQNPYGIPLMRSCEFVAKILKTIQNSTLNVWERFGDPSFSLIYKTSKREGIDLEARRQKLEDELNTAVRAKREGKSADFVRAIDNNSDIVLDVIGHKGQVLEIEIPARHVEEQIIAKSGLAPWMLARHWSTTERLSNAEAEMILADVVIRQAAKMPLFYNLIRNLLLLRGRTWKKGDWWLEWAQVNLHDIVAQAQARFLNGQADMYYMQNAEKAGITIDITDLSIGKTVGANLHKSCRGEPACSPSEGQTHRSAPTKSCTCGKEGVKELRRPTPWPALDKVEADYENTLKTSWQELQEKIFLILKLGNKSYSSNTTYTKEDLPGLESFTFTEEQRAAIMDAMKKWIGIYNIDDENSPVRWYYGQSYSLGLIQAAKLIGKERPILDIIKNQEIYNELCKSGFQLVKDNATTALVEKILPEMQAQMLAGTNPVHVASRLEKLFGDANSDWERLARSEMSMAAENAKLDEWAEWKVEKVEFSPAPDACAFCFSVAGEYDIGDCPVPVADTHPRCRCSIKPAESETKTIGQISPIRPIDKDLQDLKDKISEIPKMITDAVSAMKPTEINIHPPDIKVEAPNITFPEIKMPDVNVHNAEQPIHLTVEMKGEKKTSVRTGKAKRNDDGTISIEMIEEEKTDG